jgi:muramoyltetrapeptide carboxypeptidase
MGEALTSRKAERGGGFGPAELKALVQNAVGSTVQVTGKEALWAPEEQEYHGGRTDDRERAADIQQALADDAVAAIVALRGGAWLTRILPLIDFAVLDRRTRPVAVFGFSEITTLVNIVGAHRLGVGVYDNAPAFLTYGLKEYAEHRAASGELAGRTPQQWAQSRLISEFRAFFQDVMSMIAGRGTRREINARLVAGSLPERSEAIFIGGNLTVLTTLPASPYAECVAPSGRWIVLEDYRESPARLDRMIAQLTLADYWNTCAGVLLGDFHRDAEDLTDAVVSLLRFHLSADRAVPVLVSGQFGHVWPMSPVPVHLPSTIQRVSERDYTISCGGAALQTLPPGGEFADGAADP